MSLNNICPDCKKVYSNKPIRCMCGWYFTNEREENTSSYQCRYFYADNEQCLLMGTRSLSTRASSAWYCGEHADELRTRSYKR